MNENIDIENTNNEDLKNERQLETENEIDDEPKESEKSKQSLERAKHALRYGIAALSLVSFITTSKGLENVIPSENKITPYLISFGIQILVLVVGTELAKIIKTVFSLDLKTIFKTLVAVSIVVPYIASISFSSYFSYVFISNRAYENVRETDYNIEIDSFLNEEISNLEELNDAAGQITLTTIQSFVPEIQGFLQQFSENASAKIDNLLNGLTFYSTNKIDESLLFNANDAIVSYNANDAQSTRLRTLENRIKNVTGSYVNHYNQYLTNYNLISTTTDIDDFKSYATTMIKTLNTNIKNIKAEQVALANITDSNEDFNQMVTSSTSAISNIYGGLIAANNQLLQICQLVDTDKTVSQGVIDLTNIYNTIYSTTNIDNDNVNSAISDLEEIINFTVNSTDFSTSDSDSLSRLSACITYMGEFKKYKNLSIAINDYNDNVLNQVYVIEYSETITADTQDKDDRNNIDVNYVSKEKWNKIRRQNLAEFINMIKSLPNFEVILNALPEDYSQVERYVNLLRKNTNYKLKTTDSAYKLSRQYLEEISDIEKARNYFHSDFKYMATYSLSVSLFLDLSSMFVGLFIYFSNNKKATNEESSSKDQS